MPQPWDIFKLLADPTRLRIVSLLAREELSVAELQEILDMGQSRISSHLAILRQADLVVDRREGKKSFYSVNKRLPVRGQTLLRDACAAAAENELLLADTEALDRILSRRRRQSEEYFNALAGRLGKNYCPGRSWEAIGHFLLLLAPRIRVADLGAGEGTVSQLLARRAERVYCIDNSPKMVEFGGDLARKYGVDNLEYRLGDIEEVPLPDHSVDLALLSQALHHAPHPERAIAEAFRILEPGGQLIVLDLREHQFEKARELYADLWLGFSENKLYRWLNEAGFEQVDVRRVSREEREPYFETILASGIRPAG